MGVAESVAETADGALTPPLFAAKIPCTLAVTVSSTPGFAKARPGIAITTIAIASAVSFARLDMPFLPRLLNIVFLAVIVFPFNRPTFTYGCCEL